MGCVSNYVSAHEPSPLHLLKKRGTQVLELPSHAQDDEHPRSQRNVWRRAYCRILGGRSGQEEWIVLLALITILFSFAVLHHLTLSLAVDPVFRPAMHPAVHRHARHLLYADPPAMVPADIPTDLVPLALVDD